MSLPEYAELHCLSNFSFLRGASHPDEMVAEAKRLGLAGVGVADRCTLAGVVRDYGRFSCDPSGIVSLAHRETYL